MKASLSHVMDWMFVSSQNLDVETLTPIVAVFEDRASKKVIKVKWGYRVCPWSDGLLPLLEEITRQHSHTFSLPLSYPPSLFPFPFPLPPSFTKKRSYVHMEMVATYEPREEVLMKPTLPAP